MRRSRNSKINLTEILKIQNGVILKFFFKFLFPELSKTPKMKRIICALLAFFITVAMIEARPEVRASPLQQSLEASKNDNADLLSRIYSLPEPEKLEEIAFPTKHRRASCKFYFLQNLRTFDPNFLNLFLQICECALGKFVRLGNALNNFW